MERRKYFVIAGSCYVQQEHRSFFVCIRDLHVCMTVVIPFAPRDIFVKFINSHWLIYKMYWNEGPWNHLKLSQCCRALNRKSRCQSKHLIRVTTRLTPIWRQIWKLFSEVKYGSAAIFFRIGYKNSRAARFWRGRRCLRTRELILHGLIKREDMN